jgi:hypothetical protein
MMRFSNNSEFPDTVSAKFLVMAIGIIGLTFPLVLIVGASVLQDCELVQNSISAYYHTDMRNYFVGALCGISLCLLAYNGYNIIDKWTATAASVFAIGVAFFPTNYGEPYTDCLTETVSYGMVGTLHFVFATLLFLTLAFFALVIFTQTPEGYEPSIAKKRMLNFYRFCGGIILLCIILIALFFIINDDSGSPLALKRPVYFLEAIALVFFSLSWIVKYYDIPVHAKKAI